MDGGADTLNDLNRLFNKRVVLPRFMQLRLICLNMGMTYLHDELLCGHNRTLRWSSVSVF